MAYNENPNMTTYISARENPLADYKYILPLKRYLTQDEIDKEPRRWEYYEAGDLTICFYTQNELLDFAKEIFKHRFSGEWEFYYKPFRSNTSIKIENI